MPGRMYLASGAFCAIAIPDSMAKIITRFVFMDAFPFFQYARQKNCTTSFSAVEPVKVALVGLVAVCVKRSVVVVLSSARHACPFVAVLSPVNIYVPATHDAATNVPAVFPPAKPLAMHDPVVPIGTAPPLKSSVAFIMVAIKFPEALQVDVDDEIATLLALDLHSAVSFPAENEKNPEIKLDACITSKVLHGDETLETPIKLAPNRHRKVSPDPPTS